MNLSISHLHSVRGLAKEPRERGSIIRALIHKTLKETNRPKKTSIPGVESLERVHWCPDRELEASGQRVWWEHSNTVSYAEVIYVGDITFVRAKVERHMGYALR
jgi:hypothetical protein